MHLLDRSTTIITSPATRSAETIYLEVAETPTTCVSIRSATTSRFHVFLATTTPILADCDLLLDPSISTTLGTLCSWHEPETWKMLRKAIAQGPPGTKKWQST